MIRIVTTPPILQLPPPNRVVLPEWDRIDPPKPGDKPTTH